MGVGAVGKGAKQEISCHLSLKLSSCHRGLTMALSKLGTLALSMEGVKDTLFVHKQERITFLEGPRPLTQVEVVDSLWDTNDITCDVAKLLIWHVDTVTHGM